MFLSCVFALYNEQFAVHFYLCSFALARAKKCEPTNQKIIIKIKLKPTKPQKTRTSKHKNNKELLANEQNDQ
jgi:hypothetical protein